MLKLPVPGLRQRKAGRHPRASNTRVEGARCRALAKRAEALRNGRVDPREDNMLKITTEGRKAALDLRLLNPVAPTIPTAKSTWQSTKFSSIWQETAPTSVPPNSCSAICPRRHGYAGFSVYDDMRDETGASLGVPTNEIAFIQDYDSDAPKLALFKDVRAGQGSHS